MAPAKTPNRDRRSPVDHQFEDPKRFKNTKRSQVDDDDDEDSELMNTKAQRSSDEDYVQNRNSFGDDDDYDDDDAPVVANTQTSKSSAKRRVVESDEEEVVDEEHSKISKKLSGAFAGSYSSFTLNPSSQKKSKTSSNESGNRHESSHKKRNTNEHLQKLFGDRIGKIEESVNRLVQFIASKGHNTPRRYKQTSVAAKLFLTDSQKVAIGHMVRKKCLKALNFWIMVSCIRRATKFSRNVWRQPKLT
jgi:hypothetical protein